MMEPAGGFTPPTVMSGNCLGRPTLPPGVTENAYCEMDGLILLVRPISHFFCCLYFFSQCPLGRWGVCPPDFMCTVLTNTTAACQNAAGDIAEPTLVGAASRVAGVALAMIAALVSVALHS